MLRVFFAIVFACFLSGCWQSNTSQFNAESLLVNDLPERMSVTFNGNTGLVARVDGSRTTYEGFGFNEIKFKEVRMSVQSHLFVQIRHMETGQYYFFLLGTGQGHARDKLRGANQLQLGTGFPSRGGTVANNKFTPPLVGTKLAFRGAAVTVTDLDGMTDAQIAALVQSQKQSSAAGRFDRAVWRETLKNCNKAVAFVNTGSLGALFSSFQIEADRCIIANAFNKLSLGFEGLDNLQCTEGSPRTCQALIRYNCLATGTVANDQRLNRAICAGFKAMRQPVIFTARDDGENVVIEQFELVKP